MCRDTDALENGLSFATAHASRTSIAETATGAGTGGTGSGKEADALEGISAAEALRPTDLPRWEEKDMMQSWLSAEIVMP